MAHSPIQATLTLVDRMENHVLEVALSESLSLPEKLDMIQMAEKTLAGVAETERLKGNIAFAAEIAGRIDRIIAKAEHHALTENQAVWEEVLNFTFFDRLKLYVQRLFRRGPA